MKSSNKAYPIRGDTMLLTDALDLYKISNSKDEKSNNDYENINDEFN